MTIKHNNKSAKERILSTCVQMFIEKGFKQTTMLDIIKEANVSAGTFQNIFRTKDGVLLALVEFMFENQFSIARSTIKNENGILIYAIETAIQLAITECNENLREIYIEAYTQPELCEYIHKKTTIENIKFFSKYNSNWETSDFYEAEIGSSGIMRSFVVHKCDMYFTLKKKTERFLSMAFDIYHIPNDEARQAITVINSMDIIAIANSVMKQLFSKLEMTFDFKFSNSPS